MSYPQMPMMPYPMTMVPTEPDCLRNLMVNYIPTTIDDTQLRQLFEMYGPIESIKIVSDRETHQSRGYGFVKYRQGYSAVHAIQYLNGYPLMNKRLKVAYANAADAQKAIAAGELSAGMSYPVGIPMPMGYASYQGYPSDPSQAYAQQQQQQQQQQTMQMMYYQHMLGQASMGPQPPSPGTSPRPPPSSGQS